MGHGRLRLSLIIVLLMSILLFSIEAPLAFAQPEARYYLSPSDQFPSVNGSISFAINGTYYDATVSNGVWSFIGLKLNNSRYTANISISAENCNLTIYSVSAFNVTARSVSIRYYVTGEGTQTVRFLDLTQKTDPAEWSVVIRDPSGNIWLSEGQNWDLQANNTMFVHGIRGNLSVSRFNFGGLPDLSNVPYYLQHSIALITLGVFIAVVATILVFKVTTRRKL